MSDPEASGDLEALTAQLKALSSINRLQLIDQLDRPRTVGDVHLTPTKTGQGENPDRKLTREGIRHHLSRLEDAGLVRSSVRVNDSGRNERAYVVDEAAAFGLVEELRDVVVPGTDVQLDPFRTDPAQPEAESEWPSGPRLVLVRGAEADEVFALDEIETAEGPDRGWVIGRSPEASISLQFDPYLSSQNTEVIREDGFQVVDLRSSRNGTVLNDEPLQPGEPVPLDHGDLIQVGCSALLFHDP